MSLSSDPRWADFRSQIPAAEKWAYFEHSAISPLPAPTRNAIAQWLDEATYQAAAAWYKWDRRLQEVRATAAKMVGAERDEIALVHSTTEGVSIVAEGFPWREGDNVVLPSDEFPANQYPWLNLASRGVETRRVPVEGGRIDLDRLEAACDERTRIVALSWVGYISGWRTDLDAAAEMAHRRGALILVDVIQGLGAFPLDVGKTPIDFFAAEGRKWLLSPEGTGLLYVKRKHLSTLRPVGVGWNSVVQGHDFTNIELRLKESTTRYEGGAPNSVGFIGMGASLDLLLSFGLDAISERILEITDACCQRLRQMGAVIYSRREERKHCSGIVTFEIPGCNPQALREHCAERHVSISCRSGRLRISPQAYINDDDIDRLIESLEEGRKTVAKKS
jgi:selenocysteine lyase/cysteine desulfurase